MRLRDGRLRGRPLAAPWSPMRLRDGRLRAGPLGRHCKPGVAGGLLGRMPAGAPRPGRRDA